MYNLKKVLEQLLERIGNVTMGTTATTITGAIAEHESDIDALNSNLKIGYFDIVVPAGVSSYNFNNDKPSDYYRAINAISVQGGAAIISQIGGGGVILYFQSALSGSSTIRITYIKNST